MTANTFAREGYRFTGWNTRGDGKGKAFADKQAVTNLLAHDGATGVLYAQWEDAMTVMPETGGTVGDHGFEKTIGGGLPLRPHPHPIRAAAHAPKPVASTGRAV